MNKLAAKYVERLNEPRVTESTIIHFKSKVLGQWSKTSLTDEDKNQLKAILETSPVKGITLEQSNKGIEYLTRKLYTSKGKVRNDKFTRVVGLDFVEAVKDFKSFQWVGYAIVRENGFVRQYNPIYRLITNSGEYYDYTMTARLFIDVIESGNIEDASKTCTVSAYANEGEWR